MTTPSSTARWACRPRSSASTTETSAPCAPTSRPPSIWPSTCHPDRVLITESGIRGYDDLHRLAAVGAHCLLVGESLLRQPDLTAATRALMGDGRCP